MLIFFIAFPRARVKITSQGADIRYPEGFYFYDSGNITLELWQSSREWERGTIKAKIDGLDGLIYLRLTGRRLNDP